MTFTFGTKGETLARLRPLLVVPSLCEQEMFSVAEWQADSDGVLKSIIGSFKDKKLAVRSCAKNEDGKVHSMAGAYTSVIDVASEAQAVRSAIGAVVASYTDDLPGNQVLVQPMVAAVTISGVLMTRELNTGSPYYSVNYDDFSGRTDSVTSGAESKLFLVRRSHVSALRSSRFRKLLDAVQEIERVTGVNDLDIEFCITAKDEVFILQVRPMTAGKQWSAFADQDIEDLLDATQEQIAAMMARDDGLFGETTVLGDMPDWNPAEMLGSHPRPLALSLYRRLITDRTWAVARARMGYRDLSRHMLLSEIAGRPYIDVRKSLNSFLPASVADDFAERLINHQIRLLSENRHWHDKIEFHVAITCADFSLPSRLEALRHAGFDADEVAAFGAGLRELTGSILKDPIAQLDALRREASMLDVSRQKAVVADPGARFRTLLADCVPYGTLPFACAARHGFIAISLLRSLVETGALSQDAADWFLQSVHTVAAQIVADMNAVGEGSLETAAFLDRYGHLRPGTYDILSHRYDETPEVYLGNCNVIRRFERPSFSLSAAQATSVEGLLKEFGYECTPAVLFDYMEQSIALRESVKFEMTKIISDALEAIRLWGEQQGLTREQLAFLTIEEIEDDAAEWPALAAEALERHTTVRAVRLPNLLVSPSDIDVVRLPIGHANFITHRQIIGPIEVLASDPLTDIDGKIILIESADPGFDWIFSHDIKGLITKYGGANSHMAIRCAEFGLPAAIGCGERLFDSLVEANVVELNCSSRTIKVVQ